MGSRDERDKRLESGSCLMGEVATSRPLDKHLSAMSPLHASEKMKVAQGWGPKVPRPRKPCTKHVHWTAKRRVTRGRRAGAEGGG